MRIVPAVHTPMAAEHARDALLAAMPKLDRESAALLLSLVWVETGRGGLLNWNAGNLSANDAWPGDAWRPPWYLNTGDPRWADLHDRMLKGTAPSAFRGYATAAEGFADFARVLEHTFPTVLAAAATGDPAVFVRALHDSRYSQDYSPAHISTFAQLRHSFEPLVSHLPASGSAIGVGVGLVVAGLLLVAFKRHSRKARAQPWR
jgi:hypothetical protein